MIINLIVIAISFVSLIYGANFFVSGAASISRKLGISAFVVGLTVVAMGTSAPELFVNVIAAFQGATDIAIGNILGSNIADIMLGLGVAAMIYPLSIKRGTVFKELPFFILASVILVIFGSDAFIDGTFPNQISRTEGIALLSFFVIFIVYTFGLNGATKEDTETDIEIYSWFRSIASIVGGITGLVIGGKYVVSGAVALASALGLSQNLIALTIVAAGTSLPEIVTAIVAVRKRNIDFVVGGIVGTVIFNTLFALGVTALVQPLPFGPASITDSFILVGATLGLFLLMFIGKKNVIERWQGLLLVLCYISYIIFAIIRG